MSTSISIQARTCLGWLRSLARHVMMMAGNGARVLVFVRLEDGGGAWVSLLLVAFEGLEHLLATA